MAAATLRFPGVEEGRRGDGGGPNAVRVTAEEMLAAGSRGLDLVLWIDGDGRIRGNYAEPDLRGLLEDGA